MAHRDRWASRTTFLLASFGSAIGLGNLWRFPMIAYDNGGGAFLIPYIVALLTAGIPLMMLEFAVGQWFQRSTPGSFRAVGRKWEFVGWWALGVGTIICAYYAVIMAPAIGALVGAGLVDLGAPSVEFLLAAFELHPGGFHLLGVRARLSHQGLGGFDFLLPGPFPKQR